MERPPESPNEPGRTDAGRYVALQMNEEQVVVYDAEVETAWIQSDTTITTESMQ